MNTIFRNNFSVNIGYAIIVTLCFSCSAKNPVKSPAEAAEVLPEDIVEMRYDQIKIAEIDTGQVQVLSLNGILKAIGKVTVAPQNYATVSSPLGGFVKGTSLLPGNAVVKGQKLALIENQEFVDIQKAYLEARSRLEFAEAEFKRHSALFKEDVYSEQNLQEVTANYKSLKAQVTALSQNLELIGIDPSGVREDNITRFVTLLSPISGYITNANINIGKSITSTDILFEIVNTNSLTLELTLFEKDAGKVTAGQKIKFFITNETEEHIAVVTQTGRSIDADKTFRVYALVTKGCKNIIPGMYVNANIETSGGSVTALPSDAVVSFDDKDYIFVFYRNKEENGDSFTEYKILEVHKGVTEGGNTEVILPENFDIKNSKVVIKGAYNLLSAKKNAGEMAC